MSKKCRLVLILLFVILSANYAIAETILTRLVKKIQPAVVTIVAYDMAKKVLGQGTGFFVDKKGLVITNYHVLKGAYSAEVKIYNGMTYPITLILGDNETVDLVKVLVDIPIQPPHWLTVTRKLPDVAERILVVGSPMGLEQTVSEGLVSGIREAPNIGKIYQITAPISPGSSGSPVINMKGEAIGVATFYLMEGQNLNFAVPGEYALDLKQMKTCKTITAWTNDIKKMNFAIAEKLFRKAVNLRTGVALRKSRKKSEVISFLEQAIERNPGHVLAWHELANIYEFCGPIKKALATYRKALQINPNSAFLHKHIAFFYSLYIKQPENSIKHCKQAIQIDPEYYEAHNLLGNNYYYSTRYEEAMECYKQAIRINPDYCHSHCSLGKVYVDMGNRAAALEEYKILKNLAIENHEDTKKEKLTKIFCEYDATTLFDYIYYKQ